MILKQTKNMVRLSVLMLGASALCVPGSFASPTDFVVNLSAHAYKPSPYTLVATNTAAENVIKKLGEDAVAFLSNTNLSTTQKEKEFRRLMNANFDMKTIGRFTLGRNWRNATEAQKKEYQKLFEKMIVSVYTQRLDNYQGQAFEIQGSQEAGKKDVVVTSYIVPESGSKVKVDWRLRKKDGKYKIIDILVEGISMSLTQRSDFSSVIQRGGGDIEALLEHLRK